MPAIHRSTIALSPALRSLRANSNASSFSARLDIITNRYQAIIAELTPKLTVAEWRIILPLLSESSFSQPGDVYIVPLRLKSSANPLAYKLDAMKLPELIALIEAGQAFLAQHPEATDEDIQQGLKARP